MKNVAETNSDDNFETPPPKSLKIVVEKRLANKIDERRKKEVKTDQ